MKDIRRLLRWVALTSDVQKHVGRSSCLRRSDRGNRRRTAWVEDGSGLPGIGSGFVRLRSGHEHVANGGGRCLAGWEDGAVRAPANPAADSGNPPWKTRVARNAWHRAGNTFAADPSPSISAGLPAMPGTEHKVSARLRRRHSRCGLRHCHKAHGQCLMELRPPDAASDSGPLTRNSSTAVLQRFCRARPDSFWPTSKDSS
jgi:hypothetical protein